MHSRLRDPVRAAYYPVMVTLDGQSLTMTDVKVVAVTNVRVVVDQNARERMVRTRGAVSSLVDANSPVLRREHRRGVVGEYAFVLERSRTATTKCYSVACMRLRRAFGTGGSAGHDAHTGKCLGERVVWCPRRGG